jgi:ubiquinone biosynthesis protein
MLLEMLGTARDLGRLNEVASVLVRHGLGDLVQRWGIAGILQRAGRAIHLQAAERLEPRTTAQRMRLALEDLGPTYVKLGQLLAGRSDLLPVEWTEELARLQEEVREVPWTDVRAQLCEDLGRAPEEVFAALDPVPLAAASIAQVHRARLVDGTEVVLKVRRPGIAEQVDGDLRLFQRLAELAEHEMPELRPWRLRALARHFARTIQAELDLRIEARNAAAVAANMDAHPALVVPRVHAAYSSERLLVQDFLAGPSAAEWIRAGRPAAFSDIAVDGPRLASLGADVVLDMVFVHGLYHADPHAGNVILLGGGRLGLIDFGRVGRLSEARRVEFLGLMGAIVARRAEDLADILLDWGAEADPDPDLFTQDCQAFIDRYHGVTLADLDAAALVRDVLHLVRENHLSLPVEVSALMHAFVTLDGLAVALDPDFDMAAHVEPFARAERRRRVSPLGLARRTLRGFEALGRTLPRDLARLMSRARRGRLRLKFELRHLEQFGAQLDRSANRVVIGMVTSALIVGTSISLTVSSGPSLWGLPVFATLGFASSVFLGLTLIWSIWRSSKR